MPKASLEISTDRAKTLREEQHVLTATRHHGDRGSDMLTSQFHRPPSYSDAAVRTHVHAAHVCFKLFGQTTPPALLDFYLENLKCTT